MKLNQKNTRRDLSSDQNPKNDDFKGVFIYQGNRVSPAFFRGPVPLPPTVLGSAMDTRVFVSSADQSFPLHPRPSPGPASCATPSRKQSSLHKCECTLGRAPSYHGGDSHLTKCSLLPEPLWYQCGLSGREQKHHLTDALWFGKKRATCTLIDVHISPVR